MTLRSLSDHELLSRIQTLTRRERSLTLAVLLHLNEIERRRLHLKQGYASLYAYCTSGLGYSNSAASRRIRTARCVARFPEVYGLLETNEVNVSTVAQVSRILTAGNKDAVLARIRGRSQREVEAIVAEYEPREAMPRDRVRSVVVRVPVALVPEFMPGGVNGPVEAPATSHTIPAPAPAANHDRNGRAANPPDDVPAGAETATFATQLEKRTMVEFCASESFMARCEKLRSLMWHRLPVRPTMEQVLSLALEYVIEREDPEKRQARRSQKRAAGAAPIAPTSPGGKTATSAGAKTKPAAENPRRIPAEVRDDVFARDSGRCTFTGPTGRRCGSTRALQVDHVLPVARGGTATTENLRLLCAFHNRIEAERILGARYDRYGRGPAHNAASTRGSWPTPRVPGSCPGRPFRAPT